ncbi:MAG: TRAP transporter small permease [Limnochordia bacterium]|jgi:TRAP-type C4-dicarboxylate transport system permease small subunit|nr:TRAP transporter small permease [Bacillota bacterium]
MEKLDRTRELLTRICEIGIIILMTCMTIVVWYGVVGRYILHKTVVWTEELARYLMIWTAYMGTGLAFYQGAHVGVTFVIDKLPFKVRKWILLLGNVVIGWFYYLVVRHGYVIVKRVHRQLAPSLRVPMSYAYAAVFVGGIIFFVYLFFATIELLTAKEEPTRIQIGEDA